MPFNPAILADALEARSLSRSDLSARLGVTEKRLVRELGQEPEPSMGLVGDIAKELSLPKFVFFMAETPSLSGALPDFRSDKPKKSAKSRATVEAIQFAEGIQHTLVQLRAAPGRALPSLDMGTKDVAGAALEIRSFFGITLKDQVEAKDARTFYTVVRKRIEDAGIVVLHSSFPSEDGSGFCVYHRQHPVIVVNTKNQTRGRRLFTLVHELAHVLLGVSGISDPFISRNSVERFCNRFAAAFLVPKKYLSALLKNAALPRVPDLDDVARAARLLKTSQQAAVMRLEELGVFEAGSQGLWLAAISKLGINPDFKDKGGGAGGPPPQEKVKLARYGFRFAQAFDDLLKRGQITAIDLYRSSGLKPAYQRAYFDYSRSLTSDQLHNLELEDE